ncbi:MAG: aromatic acid exporter family protein, partial [Clostridium sp.]
MKLTFHKVGLRNIKTALAVFVCMFLFSIFNNDNPFYACIAAVICMGDTVENSLIMGKNRIIG